MLDIVVSKTEKGMTRTLAHMRVNEEDPSQAPDIELPPDNITVMLLRAALAYIEEMDRRVADALGVRL